MYVYIVYIYNVCVCVCMYIHMYLNHVRVWTEVYAGAEQAGRAKGLDILQGRLEGDSARLLRRDPLPLHGPPRQNHGRCVRVRVRACASVSYGGGLGGR